MDNKVHYGDLDFVASLVNRLRNIAFAARGAPQLCLERTAKRPIAAADPWHLR